MTTAAIQDRVDELFTDAPNVHAQAIERFRTAIFAMRRRRPGAPPSAPPTPSSWPEPSSSHLPRRPPQITSTTSAVSSRKFKRSKVATTAESTTCTVCASIPAIATSRPSAASTKPPRISTTPRPSPLDEWQILNCQPSCGRGPSPQRGSGHFQPRRTSNPGTGCK